MSDEVNMITEVAGLPVLTSEQIEIIEANWRKDIGEITRLVFNDDSLDGRTNEAKVVKMYLVSKDREIKTTKKVVKGDLELTDQQKMFIKMNAPSMKALEMTKALFPNKEITTLLGSEGRAVYKYAQELDKNHVDFWDEPVESREYKSPRSVPQVLGLANSYISNQLDPSKEAYDFNNLRPFEEKCLRALQGFLRTIRFRYQASSYEKKADRILFESSFIRMTHDKPDLSAADVDMYVAAAAEQVNITREERKILKLEEKLEEILDGEGEERRALTQSFVELLNQTRTKWDASKARYKGFVDSLESTRAKRDETKIKQNQSVLNLLEAWQKSEETRNQIIAFGEKEKHEDKDEVKRLEKFEGVIALIAGHTRQEAGN